MVIGWTCRFLLLKDELLAQSGRGLEADLTKNTGFAFVPVPAPLQPCRKCALHFYGVRFFTLCNFTSQ